MDELQQLTRQILTAQPFSRLLGATLTDLGPQSAEISLPITDDLKQQHGYAHGGVISYLADNSITFAGGLALGSDALTSEYKINFWPLLPEPCSSHEPKPRAAAQGRPSAAARSTPPTGTGNYCVYWRKAPSSPSHD